MSCADKAVYFLTEQGGDQPCFSLSPESFRFPVGVLWDAHGTHCCGVPGLDQFLAPKGRCFYFFLGKELLTSLQFH